GINLWSYLKTLVSVNQLSCLTPLLAIVLVREKLGVGARKKGPGTLSQTDGKASQSPFFGKASLSPFFLFALFNYLVCAAVWSTHEGVRFMLPSFAALAPAAMVGAAGALGERRGWRWISLAVLALTLIGYTPAIVSDARAAQAGRRRPMRLPSAERQWLDRMIPEMTPIGTDMPFEMNFYCDRPTAWTQWDNPAFNLPEFLHQYPVEILALSPQAAVALRASPWLPMLRGLGQPILAPMEWFVVNETPRR
ncbi:MAG: hypothetical protein NTW86_00785, partial [Candidatus Sumerlaeota bacterium]|nr:hypothetical protein [Candidatus Sumerlaeota bacterium]